MNRLSTLKTIMSRHIINKTQILSCGSLIDYQGNKKPYAIIVWGGSTSNRDINNIKDEERELIIRVVANDEDKLYDCIEEISTLWGKTGIGSLFQELHDKGVLSIQHTVDRPPMVFRTGDESVGDMSFKLLMRYEYQNI